MTETGTHQWTTERQVHYPLIAEVALSPDGRQVVYAVREPIMSDEKSEFVTHLYLASTRRTARRTHSPGQGCSPGGEPIQLTYGEQSDRCPRWSPDGQYIAFVSTRAQKANLYAMRVTGGEAWALTRYDKTDVRTFEWAPDGQRIAFLMAEPPTEEKEKARQARDDPILWDVDFDFVHLYCIPFAVGPRELPQVRQITRGRFHLLNLDWLPDGQRLAVTHRPTPVDEDWPQTRLAIVPVGEDRPLQDVALIADWAGSPKVSPDGSWIACATGDQPVRWGFANRIVLYPVAGGEPRPLAVTPDARCWLLGWSADGQQVYAVEASGVDSQVWALPVSGEAGCPLTDTPMIKGPLAANRDDQILFVGQDFDHPNALYMLDGTPSGGATHSKQRALGQCLVAVHCTTDGAQFVPRLLLAPAMPADWPQAPLPGAEVVRWRTPARAEGGGVIGVPNLLGELEVEGILTYPLEYQPGQRYPLVVEVHGGPAGVYGRRYLALPDQYCNIAGLAERGFCVLRVNPRGSSGYGRAFRFANYGDWGGGDYRDIMAGVDELIRRGIVDPERMGIMGWSYGGFMTSWTITQTDRFKAACVGAGVTNLMSLNGTADVPGFVPDYFGAEFWEDLEPYRQHSAMFQVQGVKTPTLIQHGQEDIRVPLGQGRELYNALKRQGVPVEMVIYPRQGHIIGEPRLLIDMRRRAVAWLERWILGEERGEGSHPGRA